MKILKSGKLKNKANGTKENYFISKLDTMHFDKLKKFQRIVLNNMDRKDLYAGLTDEELSNMLGDNGVIVGAFNEEDLIGFYAILFPGEDAYNLGNDIGISKNEMTYVAHFEGAGVHPVFRGNSLQKIMTGVCLEEAMKLKNIKYLCATVSPYNYPSIDHIFAFGLTIRDLKIKYDNMLRYICSREMESHNKMNMGSIVNIESTDHDGQLRLLKDGFVGFKLLKANGANLISFGKLEL